MRRAPRLLADYHASTKVIWLFDMRTTREEHPDQSDKVTEQLRVREGGDDRQPSLPVGKIFI